MSRFNLFMSFLTLLTDETLQMEYLWGLLIAKAEQDENLKVLYSITDFMRFSPQVPRIILMNSKGVYYIV